MKSGKVTKRNIVITVCLICVSVLSVAGIYMLQKNYCGVFFYIAAFLNLASLITLIIAAVDVKKRALTLSWFFTIVLTAAALIMAFRRYDGKWFVPVCIADAVSLAGLINNLHKRSVSKDKSGRSGSDGFFKKIASIFKRKNKLKNGKLYLRGKTKTEFVFGNRFRGEDSRRGKKTRAVPRKGKTNNEKIRLAYIKKILEMISCGKPVYPSTTPREASKLRDRGESAELYAAYEKTRYSNGYSASDEITSACLGASSDK